MTTQAYEQDFYSWTGEQAEHLRAGHFELLDTPHLIEELEAMGAREKRELRNRLRVLLMHLLKWQHQPEYIGRKSWFLTIKTQRKELGYHLSDNPGLKSTLPEAMERGYDLALDDAVAETGLSAVTFPQVCPWTFEQVIDPDFWPE